MNGITFVTEESLYRIAYLMHLIMIISWSKLPNCLNGINLFIWTIHKCHLLFSMEWICASVPWGMPNSLEEGSQPSPLSHPVIKLKKIWGTSDLFRSGNISKYGFRSSASSRVLVYLCFPNSNSLVSPNSSQAVQVPNLIFAKSFSCWEFRIEAA